MEQWKLEFVLTASNLELAAGRCNHLRVNPADASPATNRCLIGNRHHNASVCDHPILWHRDSQPLNFVDYFRKRWLPLSWPADGD